jgi:hypothetical protein
MAGATPLSPTPKHFFRKKKKALLIINSAMENCCTSLFYFVSIKVFGLMFIWQDISNKTAKLQNYVLLACDAVSLGGAHCPLF